MQLSCVLCMCQTQLPFPVGLDSRLHLLLPLPTLGPTPHNSQKHTVARALYIHSMRTGAIGKDIDTDFHNDDAHNGRKDFKYHNSTMSSTPT